MKLAPQEVYLRAAERVAKRQEEFSCCAITYADKYWAARGLYNFVMAPLADRYYLTAGDIMQAVGAPFEDQRCRDFRVLLLCMMAAAYDDVKDLYWG